MDVKILRNLLVFATFGLFAQVQTFAAEPGSVATISDAEGTVMVDHGKGFVTSNVNAPLFENDRVITLDGSLAEITFTDGCRTKLKSNNLIIISIDPGCKAAILDATRTAAQAVAGTHPASFIPPMGGVGIGIAILNSTNSISSE